MTADARRPLTALIADDEALARRRIAGLLRRRESVRVVGQSATGPATVDAVRELRPDLLFLDVQMPGLTGFEVLATLEPDEHPAIVFSTAFDEYALAAFEVNAVDYLLKPYSDDRFETSLRRAERAFRNERVGELHDRVRRLLDHVMPEPGTGQGAAARLDRFAVPAGERVALIDAADVDWIEAAGDYVRLHAGDGSHLVRGTMTTLERRLDPGRFLRIHRSTIVRLDGIRHLQSLDHGDYAVVLERGDQLRVGRHYREVVLERLGLRW